MRTLAIFAGPLVAISLVGCSSRVPLKIDVQPGVQADVRAQPAGGGAVVATCRTPCTIEIPVGDTYELTLTSPGYYPASIKVWGVVARNNSGDVLSVPLVQRRTDDGGR